ncbi:type II CAAX endopeptidase family protein [Asticcacaulis sp. DXS10W]|uniref:Type II CAAX endopeptidase family protein n=1 Tax=Asticcacaulis currens TaxID=2984210 RepID=A0ABT5IIW1_9CAUL|nr:type II CAAX endopeptidase family protein [Asticcacaulis currens]MDC7696114.1 type II CAAX endopeptidase family protein [Asticcacaulis currens]
MAGIDLYAPRPAKARRTWTWAAIVLTIVFIILGQIPVVIAMTWLKMPLETGIDWRADALMLVFFAPIALIFFLWTFVFERRGIAALGFNRDGLKRYLRGLVIGFGFAAAAIAGIWLAGGYTVESLGAWGKPGLMTFVPIAAVFIGFMVQGATEEVAMRGYLMQVVASRHGIYWGIGVSMLVFSLLHAANIPPSKELLLGLTNIVLVGIFFSLYAIQERSLWGVCAWHSAWNFLLGAGFGVEVSGQNLDVLPLVTDLKSTGAAWWITGGKFGPEGSVITSLVLILGIVYLVRKGALKPQPFAAEMAQTAA